MNQPTEDRLKNIEHRMESIEQEHFALWEIVQKVAAEDTTATIGHMDIPYCIFCFGKEDASILPDKFKHESTCIALKARALVAKKHIEY